MPGLLECFLDTDSLQTKLLLHAASSYTCTQQIPNIDNPTPVGIRLGKQWISLMFRACLFYFKLITRVDLKITTTFCEQLWKMSAEPSIGVGAEGGG